MHGAELAFCGLRELDSLITATKLVLGCMIGTNKRQRDLRGRHTERLLRSLFASSAAMPDWRGVADPKLDAGIFSAKLNQKWSV